MPTRTVGEVVAEFLELAGVEIGFGLSSVHNLPMLDAAARRGRLRFVLARGEAGAAHMADAYARVSGRLGLVITSTGPGAANAAGGLLEARTAGSPVLHLTGQVPARLIGRDTGTIHDAPDQLGMLRAVSKAAHRIAAPGQAWEVLERAAVEALTPPRGPVSVEIPIDVQRQVAGLPPPPAGWKLPLPPPLAPTAGDLDRLAERLLAARRPMLWVGSGARHAGAPLLRLLELGLGMVSSWAGRGVVPEDHPMNLGGLHGAGVEAVRRFHETVDLLLVVGSRLRGQETIDWTLPLPRARVQVDVDPSARGRTFEPELFVRGDSRLVLEGLLARVEGRLAPDPRFAGEFRAMKVAARQEFAATLGPYRDFARQLRAALPRDALFVRDLTIAHTTWGNRLFELYGPRDGVHPVGAGIGEGLPLGVGAALAGGGRKTVVLHGDAGLMLNLGELWTAAQERLDLAVVVMNDAGYGVIRHMQDARRERRHACDLRPPDLAALARAAGATYHRVEEAAAFGETVARATALPGLSLVEVDMRRIGEAPPYFPFLPPP